MALVSVREEECFAASGPSSSLQQQPPRSSLLHHRPPLPPLLLTTTTTRGDPEQPEHELDVDSIPSPDLADRGIKRRWSEADLYARPTSYAYESSALACPPLPVLDQRGPTEWPAATTDARSANALEWAIVAGRPLTSAADYPPKLGGDDDEADADDEFGRDGVEYLETGWGGGAAC